jgi:protocatechuate 3,4-dioxygenase beta subunit
MRIAVVSMVVSLLVGGPVQGSEPVIGGPCEGCGLVFEGMPDEIPSEARIAPSDEAGEPMVIEGRVFDRGGRPAPGVIVYAYHTDAGGVYPDADTRHGRLRGWARTDVRGEYRFDTIRPASYPGTTIPAHVHMHVIEPGRGTYYIDSIRFLDDPHLGSPDAESSPRGGSGLADPELVAGTWRVQRDIVLGENVPDYEASRD